MMNLNRRGSATLIGLLVVVVIIVVVVAVMWGGKMSTVSDESDLLDKASTKKTVPGRAIDTAKASACGEQLRQIRMGIQMYKATGTSEANPPTLHDAVPNVSTAYFQCPVTNQAYTYDPATGVVQCPSHPNF